MPLSRNVNNFAGVFEVYWNTISGPNVPIFSRFKNSWDKVGQSKYKTGMEDEAVAKILTNELARTVTFINNCLQVKIVYYTLLICSQLSITA